MLKIVSENQFIASIKGRNSVLICQHLPIYNPRTLLPNINSHSQFEENWLKMLPAESENDALTDRQTYRPADRQTDGHVNAFVLMEGITYYPAFLKWQGKRKYLALIIFLPSFSKKNIIIKRLVITLIYCDSPVLCGQTNHSD